MTVAVLLDRVSPPGKPPMGGAKPTEMLEV